MPCLEFGLKTGDLKEEEIIKTFEKALNKCARESEDPGISRGRKKMRKNTVHGVCNPEATVQPEYDYRYIFSHRYGALFLELYPNTDKNGVIKFPHEGLIWNLYISSWSEYPMTRELLEHPEIEVPEEFIKIKIPTENIESPVADKISKLGERQSCFGHGKPMQNRNRW